MGLGGEAGKDAPAPRRMQTLSLSFGSWWALGPPSQPPRSSESLLALPHFAHTSPVASEETRLVSPFSLRRLLRFTALPHVPCGADLAERPRVLGQPLGSLERRPRTRDEPVTVEVAWMP